MSLVSAALAAVLFGLSSGFAWARGDDAFPDPSNLIEHARSIGHRRAAQAADVGPGEAGAAGRVEAGALALRQCGQAMLLVFGNMAVLDYMSQGRSEFFEDRGQIEALLRAGRDAGNEPVILHENLPDFNKNAPARLNGTHTEAMMDEDLALWTQTTDRIQRAVKEAPKDRCSVPVAGRLPTGA